METLSHAARITWTVAATEAGSLGWPEITADHIWLSLFRVVDVRLEDLKQFSGLGDYELQVTMEEFRLLNETFARGGIEPMTARRHMRALIGMGPGVPHDHSFHRDAECRKA